MTKEWTPTTEKVPVNGWYYVRWKAQDVGSNVNSTDRALLELEDWERAEYLFSHWAPIPA